LQRDAAKIRAMFKVWAVSFAREMPNVPSIFESAGRRESVSLAKTRAMAMHSMAIANRVYTAVTTDEYDDDNGKTETREAIENETQRIATISLARALDKPTTAKDEEKKWQQSQSMLHHYAVIRTKEDWPPNIDVGLNWEQQRKELRRIWDRYSITWEAYQNDRKSMVHFSHHRLRPPLSVHFHADVSCKQMRQESGVGRICEALLSGKKGLKKI